MDNIAIIGGTGFSDDKTKPEQIKTDYGYASVSTAEIGGKEVYLIARHQNLEPPHLVNYRANIQAAKMLGVRAIYSISAAGRLAREVLPGHLIVVDDVDWDDLRRETTFAEQGLLLHVSMNKPFHPELRKILTSAYDTVCEELKELYHDSKNLQCGFHEGTYFNIQGPAFTTPAREARLRETVINPKVIGQTLVPEVHLAKEMSIPYAALAMCVDHSNYPGAPSVTHIGVMEVVTKTAKAARLVIEEAIKNTDLDELSQYNVFDDSLHSDQVNINTLRKSGRNNLAEIIQKELESRR